MVTFVTAADFHFSDNPPSSRVDNYTETLLGKLDQIYNLCRKTQAKCLLIPGDLFHIKTASKTSHRLVQVLIKKFSQFKENNCEVLTIAGNHDLSFSNLVSLEKQPLGVLLSSGVIKLLCRESDLGLQDSVFEEAGVKVRIVGCSYGELGHDSLEGLKFSRKDEDWLICMSHVFAGPLKVNFFGTMILSYQEMLNLGPDIFVFGHLHKDQNVFEVQGKYFVNVGAVSRGSVSEDDITRKPKVSVINIEKKTVKIIPLTLKVQPASEVFDLEAKEQFDARSKEINNFIELISKEGVSEERDVKDQINQLSFPQEIKERALVYLEQAQSES